MRSLLAHLHLCAFTVLICFLKISAHAEPAAVTPAPIEISDTFSQRKIGLDLALLEDHSAKLTIEQVRQPELSAQFTPSSKDSPSFGYTSSAYWARFDIHDTRSNPHYPSQHYLYLTLGYSQTDLAELWCTNRYNEIILQQSAGDHVLLDHWPVRFRNPTFKISPTARTCWLRVQTSSSLQLSLILSTHNTFFEIRNRDTAFQSLYFGALLVMIVFNTLIATTTRSFAYTYYTFFLISYALFQCAFGGIGYQILWPNRIGFSDNLTPFLVACLGVSSCAFAQIFLGLKESAPGFYKLGWWIGSLFFVSLFSVWFLQYSHAIISVMLLVPAWAVFLLGAGIYLSLKGVRTAQIYLAAWLVFIIGTLTIVISRIGLLPINDFTANASQIGSAIEFVMLSLALTYYIKHLQQKLLTEEKIISEQLRISGMQLESKVEERTQALQLANQQTQDAYTLAEASRQKAELSQMQAEQAQAEAEIAYQQTTLALEQLQTTQNQIIQTEKMASLGVLVSNVAHEMNSPIGAIQSSNMTMSDSLRSTLLNFPQLIEKLDQETLALMLQLLSHYQKENTQINSRDERNLTKQLTAFLDNAGVENAMRKAKILVRLRAHQQASLFLPLLHHPESEFILRVTAEISDVLSGVNNIRVATKNVNRIISSLRELTGTERAAAMFENQIHRSIEKALDSLEMRLQDMDVVRVYQEIPSVHCDPELLQQAWHHLILNAAQAMSHRGVIMIGLRIFNNQAEIRIADFGPGITADIRDRIFEPFFTTRASGEGGGMGLPIAKKIIEQHKGTITIESSLGSGAVVVVCLPLESPNL